MMRFPLLGLLVVGVLGCEPQGGSVLSDQAQEEFLKGLEFAGKEDYATAISCYTEAIRLDPGHASAYVQRGNAYLEQKNYDKAIADCTEVIRFLDRDNAAAYNNRGNAYYGRENYDKAIRDHSHAIRLDPDNAWAYNDRGNAYRELGDDAKAEADFAKAKELRDR